MLKNDCDSHQPNEWLIKLTILIENSVLLCPHRRIRLTRSPSPSIQAFLPFLFVEMKTSEFPIQGLQDVLHVLFNGCESIHM